MPRHPTQACVSADPPAASSPSDQTGLLVLVAPLTISTAAYVPLIEAVQVWRAASSILSHADVQWHASGDVWPMRKLKLTPHGEKDCDSCTVISGRHHWGQDAAGVSVMQVDWQAALQGFPALMPVAVRMS